MALLPRAWSPEMTVAALVIVMTAVAVQDPAAAQSGGFLQLACSFPQFRNSILGTDSAGIMNELPPHLRQQVALFLNRGVLEQMPLFENCSIPFLVAVLMRLKLYVALEGDLVITEGEIGTEMFIILQGKVAIIKAGKELGQLSKGEFFGEGGLTNGTGRRGASVHCIKMSIFYTLEGSSFDGLRGAYPEDCSMFLDVAQRRVKSRSVVKNETKTRAASIREDEEEEDEEMQRNLHKRSYWSIIRDVLS
eukprot:gene3265-4114_t